MSLRDLVEADCAQPNPLARFLHGFSNDKVGINQDQWVNQRDFSSEGGPSLTAFQQLKMMEQEKKEAELFRNIDREARADLYDPVEDDALERSYNASFHREGAHSHMLKSFVNGAHTKEFIGRGAPDLGLSMRDKEKVIDRTTVMRQHIYSDEAPDFVEGQMGHLMNNLRMHDEYDWRSPHPHAHRQPPPPPPHFVNRGPKWAGEYGDPRWAEHYEQRIHQVDPRPWAEQFASERAVNKNIIDEHDHYMEQAYNTAETNRWIEENSHRGPLLAGQEASNWAREFGHQATEAPTPRVWAEEYEDEKLEEAWDAENKAMDAAWDQAKQFTNQKSLRELTDSITRIDDPKLQGSSFMQFMRKINKGQVTFKENQVIEHEVDEADSWASEYQGLDRQFMENDWAKEYNDFRTSEGGDWARDYESFVGTVDAAKLQEYEFALHHTSNPYAELGNAFEQGVELFDQGMITESIIAFEAAVHQNPTNSKAWQYLGQAHAENDKDTQAINCLVKAVEVDPQNLEALAALAVSYTNDFNREKALEALEIWMRRHPEYSHIPASNPPPPVSAGDFYVEAWSRHSYVANLYLEAARQHPDDPDPEVQTSLGLLFNLSYEYDKAVDCFKAALTKRPTDYLLWNKLGATLANSNRSEEALGAYYKALEGKPTYVRARANLGISFLALNEYPDAANSFMSALKLHPNATHLWDNLKMVFRLMGRDDLEEIAQNHNIEDFRDQVMN